MKSYSGGVRHDYKDFDTPARARELLLHKLIPELSRRSVHWFAIGLVLPLIAVSLMLVSEPNESMVTTGDASMLPPGIDITPSQRVEPPVLPRADLALLSPGERVRLELPPLQATRDSSANRLPRPEQLEREALLNQGELLTLTVKSGDSLDRMFRRTDLSISDLAAMVALPDAKAHLARINPGDKFEIIRDGTRVLSLSREISESQQLWIKRDGEGFAVQLIDLEIEIRTAGAHGVIESSLFEAGTEAGISDAITMKMAGKFQWDIDFSLDVRTGDSFTIVYEELWRNGSKIRDGEIVAAEFINRGEVFRAARYVDATGNSEYYTPEGLNMRKAFMRNPIPIVRVSSNFNPNRRHPILNVIRAHRGVDYAAPTGTEVYASGDGKIIARGENGSYGNRIEIQHGDNVTTLYAHLSRFGSFRVGDRVKQGEIIGYVGMTGGATGPHLHYEYRINGVHQNPRTVDLPEAEPIAREYLADFQASTAGLWRQLDLYQRTLLARNDD